MGKFVTVAQKAELQPGEGKVVKAAGKEIALFNIAGSFFAIENACCHQGGPLGEGDVNGKIVTCPWHRWNFDVTTGENTQNPETKVSCFPVKIAGEDIQLEV